MIITFIGIVIITIIIVIRSTWLLKVECYDDDVCMIIRACAMCAMYVLLPSAVCNSGVQPAAVCNRAAHSSPNR